jgi:tetratricopeptide (TPR) repeat protein
MDKGHVARELQTPLFELGKLYVQEDQCQNAIPILQRAILLSQRLDGVMTPKQLPLYEPMLECFVARDMIIDLERALDQTILVGESSYGKDDIRMQSPLAHAARWYEEAGLYDNARQQYLRSIRIAEKIGGKKDPRTVNPMRGMAQTYRLEAQYAESLRSGALNAAGERSLERAANIVRMNPDTDPNLRIETLMELADWYQMAGAIRDAARIYKEVWAIASASAGDTSAGNTARTLFDEPEPILYRARIGTALRRPPPDREKLQHYWVDFEFTVTRFGEVKDVITKDSTAPKDLQISLAENLKSTHYRPRFVNGEPIETKGNHIRQGVWVGK